MTNTALSASTQRLIRISLLIAGILLLLVSFLSGRISALPLQTDWTRIVLAVLGIFSFSAGIVVGLRTNFVSKFSIFVLSIFVAFLLLEAIGAAGLFAMEKLEIDPEIASEEAEFIVTPGRYRPYVLWRASSDSPGNVTIEDNGLRAVPGSSPDTSALKVFVFGGSTVAGMNIPDSSTICAQIQSNLSSQYDDPVCVTNFGQQGYVNTQQLIELQLQLRTGNVPDLVIFYDGANEILSAVESDTAGVHFSLQEIADLYENRNFSRDLASMLTKNGFLSLANELNSIRLIKRILGEEMSSSTLSLYEAEPSSCMLYGESYVEPSTFAGEIVDIYEGDLRILNALSREFDFKYRVFWQPVLLTGNKPLTDEEQLMHASQSSFLLQLYIECEKLTIELEEQYDYFYCITDVFDEVDSAVFQDICHLNAFGDSLVAARILNNLPRI